jgi:hypothetical protein
MYLDMLFLAFNVLLTSVAAQYVLQDDYTPSAFASMFNFFTVSGPDHLTAILTYHRAMIQLMAT